MKTVREWTEKDLAKLVLCERACFSDPWTTEMIKTEFSRDDFYGLLIEEDGEILAYIYGTVLFEDAELMKVAVLPKRRGQGLGCALTEAFLQGVKERGAERIFLEVRPSNLSALKLYQGHGFVKTRLRKRYYADGEDALEMKKELTPESEE